MPSTVNGIGTTYAGKKNVTTRRASCASCGRQAVMESYDTRLWFCLVFIPLIPLKRIRVLDMCPSCRVHRVVNPAEYEAGKQLHVSGAVEEFRKQPTPQNALKVHAAMLAFHENDRAAEFRAGADEIVGRDAQALAELGGQLLGTHQAEAAWPYFERAHTLRPDLPQARAGLAYKKLGEGRLEEAHALLDFMEKPGASQVYDLHPLLVLAEKYHATGKREEALKFYKHLLEELPHLKENRHIRGVVLQLEKSVGDGSPSAIPKQPFSIRRIFSKDPHVNPPMVRIGAWAGVIALCVGIIALVWNDHQRRHRMLYVINELPGAVKVSIDDGAAISVPEGGRGVLSFVEGVHRITVSGSTKESHEATMTSPYLSRWGNDPVWVLNVGQAAPIVRYSMTYAEESQLKDVQPDADVLYKDAVSFVPHVDYLFTPPPEQLRVENKRERVVKQCLQLDDDWTTAVGAVYDPAKPGKTLDLLKWCVTHDKGGSKMLVAYLQLAAKHGKEAEAQKTLEEELDKVPLHVEVHRVMQESDPSPERLQKLAAQYASVLKEHPNDASALYLSGRLAKEPKEAQALFGKSREADPENPWPCLALAYDAAGRADWEKAASLMELVVKKKPEDGGDFLFECLLGCGRIDEIHKSLSAKVRSKSLYEAQHAVLDRVLVYSLNKEDEKAEKAIRQLRSHGLSIDRSNYTVPEFVTLGRAYAFGEFDELLAGAQKAGGDYAGYAFAAYCEKRALADALAMVQVEKFPIDPLGCLALSTVAELSNNSVESERWRGKAVTLLEESKDKDLLAIAGVLKLETLSSLDPVLELSWSAREKALLCVVLASRHQDKRQDLLALARKLNVVPRWPYHLVRAVTGES
ncbi:hypothetical protein [Roseimicrobium sp. ORNL1]|uniref:tetratricopeptide repeat protein n=1 Tax=Roseimicrobium sp. ORNL1 TaxID=2711231 RepID=UPI0013E17AF6|nr:hypothetical protein [Roseimicrobium sp. ORNL1]QIF04072.1 hypothetical protein G5S37_21920 [Roseimicrobium sp. ORNL1]